MGVIVGDCRVVLAGLPDCSVDAIVTDPPYELGFMGKSWDSSGIACDPVVWGECLRVLKPGGHLLAFGGTRTWHRLACAIEDAGFEVRDSIAWLYGSGFPKSHNVSLGIDKHFGHSNRGRAIPVASTFQASDVEQRNKLTSNPVEDYSAKTAEAEQWQGWGTALKPAHEPIVVARKPLTGTVAANVLTHGTGALNIDGCRIGTNGGGTVCNKRDAAGACQGHGDAGKSTAGETRHAMASPLSGRWPANVVTDETTAALIGDESRFFYCAKASKTDRNEGLDGFTTRGKVFNGQSDTPANKAPGSVEDKFSTKPARNYHPTVKPTNLMRWLVRLVTPPGGTVLDPFTGSGTTGKACALEGFDFIGIEQDADYAAIADARIAHARG